MFLNKWIFKRKEKIFIKQKSHKERLLPHQNLTRILDCRAPRLFGYSTTELSWKGKDMNPMYFDPGEEFDTVSHEIRSAHSTETCGYKNPQELSRLERKTLDLSTRMMKKIPTRKSIHTVIIKSASNINLGGVKRAHEESQLTWLHEQSSEEKQVVSLLCSL